MHPTSTVRHETGSPSPGGDQAHPGHPRQDRHATPAQSSVHQDDPSARAMLQQAFQRAYRWKADFRGFAAGASVNQNGRIVEGSITVLPSAEVVVTLPDDHLRRWVTDTLTAMAITRIHRTFAQAEGQFTLTLGENDRHPFGRLVLLSDTLESCYRVKEDRILQVSRMMGHMKSVINVEDTIRTPDGRHLTTKHIAYSFSSNNGHLLKAESFTDKHVHVGDAVLPGYRQMVLSEGATVIVRTLTFYGHRMLENTDGGAAQVISR
ncbi:MAG: DUF3386 family protein [Nitrospiraceae bacterium]